MVEADLHDIYGIDIGDRDLLTRRTWFWLKTRIAGLASCDSRLARALTPDRPTRK